MTSNSNTWAIHSDHMFPPSLVVGDVNAYHQDANRTSQKVKLSSRKLECNKVGLERASECKGMFRLGVKVIVN